MRELVIKKILETGCSSYCTKKTEEELSNMTDEELLNELVNLTWNFALS